MSAGEDDHVGDSKVLDIMDNSLISGTPYFTMLCNFIYFTAMT